MEAGPESAPHSKHYHIEDRKNDGERMFVLHGPSGIKMKAMIEGEKGERTLRLSEFSRSGVGSETSGGALVALKGLLVTVKNLLEKEGDMLKTIEVPTDDFELKALFGIEGMAEVLGQEEVADAFKFHNPERHADEERRMADRKPEPIRLSVWNLTERLKEYEERHGEIRQ